ncbi:protein turtle homolog A isoform X1 [Osmerus eperlanus]|uniref:protein turtle homolog A isoform X1 n=1 Tax=Osmerus eperlanus TaxID=29151 RepID=UPI002E0DD59B
MGLDRLWLLGVTTAVALCLLRTSQGVEALVRARVGGSAELACSLTPPSGRATTPNLFPLHVVEWVRLGYNVPILIKFGVYAPRVHPNYKGRVSLTRGASLLVEGLSLEDEGWFECRILLLDHTADDLRNGTWTFLSITAPPVFIQTPPTFVEVLQGDSVTLSCGAHGNPRPIVVWHKDKTPIVKHAKIKVLNGTLSVATASRETSGTYMCHVSNTEGNITHVTQLQVKGPPIILISPEDTTLNMSQDALLQCQADAYPSNLTYEWWKHGENVYHIEHLKSRVKILVDGTLLIPNLVPEDAGNYTCVPTNGILTPPSASARLKVKHPARVGRMQRETYLPAGMEGVIACPVQADPPAIYVNWTKDGNLLDLDNFPGWMVNNEGSVFIATANDDAVGMYTCTAYNSYGTMGQSGPTNVLLKDPPSFRVPPRDEYLQEVGRELVVPCEANGDPAPNITWSKIGPFPRSAFTVLANGSLLLQPLSKDHQGAWACYATNRVATVSASTVIMVLGTSPHTAASVSVSTGLNQANVSWEPGFDGGYTQKFTVWVKQASRGKHEWSSLPVPTSKTYLLVTGLLSGTGYQFSVLPQNKLGSGPFSEIVSVRTQVLPTEPPTEVTTPPYLEPPEILSANRTAQGVLLLWAPPEAPSSPLTGYLLQARRDRAQWVIINDALGANQTQLLVQGLLRDSNYDLRLMSRSNKLLSEPSDSVNVSTTGMDMYPVRPGFLEFVPEPLLAGVLGGVCFLFVAIILSLVTACFMTHRRHRRRRKRREDLPSAFQKSLSPQARSPSDSPDSVLKLKFCPPLSFFPNSSSSQSDRSSFDKGSRGEYQDQRRQLLSSSSPPPHYTLFESHLGCQASSPTALESITRGPDGRFIVQPLPEGSSPSSKKGSKKDFLQNGGEGSGSGSNRTSFRDSPKSSTLNSEKEEQKASPLTVEEADPSRAPHSPGRVRAMARNFSRHGCFYSDDEQGSEALLERASFYSDNGEKRDSLKRCHALGYADDLLPGLASRDRLPERERDRPHPSGYHPVEGDSSTLVSRLDGSDPERDSVRKRQQLAREREEIERELESYTANPRQPEKAGGPIGEGGGAEAEDPIWKQQEIPLRHKSHRASGQTTRASDYRRACYFGNTSSPMDRVPSSCIQWDISPVTSVTTHIPAQRPIESPAARAPHTPQADPARDSPPVDSSHSPVTQCTSLYLLSQNLSAESPPLCLGNPRPPSRARSGSPDREAESLRRRSMVEGGWKGKAEPGGGALKTRSSYAYGTQQPELAREGGQAGTDRELDVSPGQSYLETTRYGLSGNREAEQTEARDPGGHSPSSYDTLPYDLHRIGTKVPVRDDKSEDDRRASLLYSEMEREGVRARSRRSDCLFGESSSRISPLTLVEECDSDQSHFSVARMSGSFKTKPAAQPPKMSPLQTSAILEYLSLPGFIEMSVDDPGEESALPDSSSRLTELKPEGSLVGKPDVVPENWEVHVQERRATPSSQKTVSFEETASSSRDDEKPQYRRNLSVTGEMGLREGCSDKTKRPSPASLHPSKYHYSQPPSSSEGPHSRRSPGLAQTLASAARSMADIVSKHSDGFEDRPESAAEQSQRHYPQGNQTNKITSRIYQVPVPFMRKSLSIGPCRTLSGMGQPRPFLKKSTSLGSQKWEHFESPRTYISEKCYWDELPNPDVRVKSYSLGRTPASFPRPGLSWRESALRPSAGSLERPHHADRALPSPSYLTPTMCPPSHTSGWGRRELYDPRRQAAAFHDPSRWPVTYHHEALRAGQHKYVPLDSSIPQYPPRPSSRGPPDTSMPHYPPRPSSRGPPDTSMPHYPPRPSSRGPPDTSMPHYPPRPSSRGPPDTSMPNYPPRPSSRGPPDTSMPHYPLRPTSRGPPDSSILHYQPRPSSRGPIEPQGPPRVPPRSYLPRMYSWPSPHHAPVPPRDSEGPREAERGLGRGPEAEARETREGGRTSYASQSSGRGSVGLLRQSLSITPTLLSSPETTEESERHRAEMELRERRAKRRNTSVDESYEWDSADVCVDSEVLEAMRLDQRGVGKGRGEFRHHPPLSEAGLQDLQRKGPPPPISPPVSDPPRSQYSRSLSEARFNALRQEFQEYRRGQEASRPREGPRDTDSDSNSALL